MILNTTSTTSHDASACDESRCVSTGMSEEYGGSFTCYGDDDGMVYPKLCADGFLPVVVEGQEAKLADFDASGNEKIPVRYFTCCPPVSAQQDTIVSQNAAARHCSDPITFRRNTTDTNEAEEACNNRGDSQTYPRRMKSNLAESYGISGMIEDRTEVDAFLCCDELLLPTTAGDDNLFDKTGNNDTGATTSSEPTVATENFLETSACVSYRNEFYEPSHTRNRVGQLGVISCDFADGSFAVPRPIDGDEAADASLSGRYRCCQSGTALSPYVQDSAFRITIYPLLILDCIAALASITVIVGLLIPLVMQLRSGSFHRTQRRQSQRRPSRWVNSTSSKTRSSELFRPPSQTTSSRNFQASSEGPPHSEQAPIQRGYSTYNLYLVYLAIPDLLWAVIRIGLEASVIHQAHNPSFYTMLVLPSTVSWVGYAVDGPISASILLANFWLNAIISHQVWLLLKSFRRAQRTPQPSLRRVSLQALAVYLGAAVYLGFDWFVREAARAAEAAEDFDRAFSLTSVVFSVFYALAILPIGYVVGMSAWVWYRGYIPSSKGDNTAASRGIRELFFYFFRIVVIFVGLFVPSLLLNAVGGLYGQTWAFILCMATGSLQAIATTCVILTKSDARKYLRDLVTLSYVFGGTTDGGVTDRPCSDLQNNTENETTGAGPLASGSESIQ